jgi:hypothetical protein
MTITPVVLPAYTDLGPDVRTPVVRGCWTEASESRSEVCLSECNGRREIRAASSAG